MTAKNVLDRIRAIIDSDITAIEKTAAKHALDSSDARKLCDYAKLEISLQRHDADLMEADELNEMAKKDYENALAQLQTITKAEAEEDDEE